MTNKSDLQTVETAYKTINGQINIDEAQGIVECFVAGVGNKDSVGDIVLPGAFTESLKRRKPRVVWGHNWNEPIGKVLEIYEVPASDSRLPAKMKRAGIGGLFARVQFNLKSERGKQAFSDVSFFGEEQEWSIGYKTLNADYDQSRKANLLREVELYEVSPVLHGANNLTGTISIKADESIKASESGPCWPGYQQLGMKKGKNGNMVPNCVPIGGDDEKSPLKDPDGGLTAAGRRHFQMTEGANLKPGVKGPADTPMKMRRKGSFLARFFTNPSGPMKDEDGKPTRLALSAAAWGEPVPQNAEDAADLAAKGRRLLDRYAATQEKGGYEEDDDDGISVPRPELGREANLPLALAKRFGGAVRVRSADPNLVVFDHMSRSGERMTMRVSYHFNGQEFMFGEPSRVKPEVVYLPMEADKPVNGNPRGTNVNARSTFVDRYEMDENPMIPEGVEPKDSPKADPLGGVIPQENVTGDVLRGYGPRRGNLEQLLKYWRPIMRKEGGFRRCKVILADHPELFPLNNICAWLHHETTGLWPNEGCHHPGMKNCKKKMKGVVNGSIWSDSQWNERLSRLAPGKSAMISIDDMKEILGDHGDDETNFKAMEEFAERLAMANEPAEIAMDDMGDEEMSKMGYESLKEFMNAEPEFISQMTDDDNWEIEGEDDSGKMVAFALPAGKDCGCGGNCGSDCGGNCGGGKPTGGQNLAQIIRAVMSMMKSAEIDPETKAGRVISGKNVQKLNQALTLLQDVLQAGGTALEAKSEYLLTVDTEDITEYKSIVDSVLDYHGISHEVTELGIVLSDADDISEEAFAAVIAADRHAKKSIGI